MYKKSIKNRCVVQLCVACCPNKNNNTIHEQPGVGWMATGGGAATINTRDRRRNKSVVQTNPTYAHRQPLEATRPLANHQREIYNKTKICHFSDFRPNPETELNMQEIEDNVQPSSSTHTQIAAARIEFKLSNNNNKQIAAFSKQAQHLRQQQPTHTHMYLRTNNPPSSPSLQRQEQQAPSSHRMMVHWHLRRVIVYMCVCVAY